MGRDPGRSRWFVSIIASSAVALVGLLIGASGAQAQAQPGVTDNEILLGGVYALSGPVRFITEPYEQGMRTVVDEVNAKGGIHGRKLKWILEDDAYQPARTLAGAKKLVERDQVFAIFGQLGTPTTLAIVPYVEQAKVPLFSANLPVDPAPKYAFGLQANYSDLIYPLTQFVIKTMPSKKIAYFYQNDDVGETGRIGLARALKESGRSLVADVGYERGTNEFETSVLKLRDAGADVVIAMGTAPSIATAMRQASALGFHPIWGTYAIGASGIMKKLLGPDIDGLIFASEEESQYSDSPGMREANELIAKHFPGASNDWVSMIGYGEGKILVHALEASGRDLTRDKLVASLNAMSDFDAGVLPVSFSPTKHVGAKSVKIFRWQGGKPEPQTDWIPIGGEQK